LPPSPKAKYDDLQLEVRIAAMPITHVNAKGKTYYLHQGTTKTGKPKYHFAMKSEGNLADSIPEGFEIYENPNSQVFLRRIPPKIITDEERQVVEEGMRKYASVQDYKIDVRGNAIEIHTAHQDSETFMEMFTGCRPDLDQTQIAELVAQVVHYSPMMQFILADAKHRTFVVQRYCFLGSIDDWIDLDQGKLAKLVGKYVKHLGNEPYFELV
jgi:hypothetical protein